ncbi:conserved membrane protein of unknown function [Tenacibaculum sp. 190524A02b]|uniref:DUF4153 domain-containing protein n=1 Tax=Tenacibaculum vairaonense TaxID=3137860 RepID=UPI0032B2DA9C
MKFIPSFGEFALKCKEAFKRFPIVIIWAIIGTFFTLTVIENKNFDTPFWGKIILTFILGISWLITTRFITEQLPKKFQWLFLLTFSFLGIFYTSIVTTERNITEESGIRFALYFIAGHLLLLIAPFITQWNNTNYFRYIKSVFIAIVRSLFFSLVLYLGITLALLAIKHLFVFDFNDKRFFQMFVVCIGIVNTWIYLADFPKNIHQKNTVQYTKALEIFVKYILIPLVIIYLIILYAYSFKILINWNLPKGWVSYLVIALSFLGFLIQVLINPVQTTIDSKIIKKFTPKFYYALVPLLILLFIAIFRRISEYGFTENRYFVLVLAFWILGITLYMLFSKSKKIRVFFSSLAILCVFASFGFWGAFSIATKSQIHQFKKVYNSLLTSDFVTTTKTKKQLSSILYYLNDKKQLTKLTPILNYNPTTTFSTLKSWELPNRILDSLQIKTTDTPLANSKYRHLNINESDLLIPIKNYDFFKIMYFNNYEKDQNRIHGYFFKIINDKNLVEISNKKQRYTIVLSTKINSLSLLTQDYNIDPAMMTIEKEWEDIAVKILFQNINLTKKNTNYTINNAQAYVFIKEKNAK